MSQENVELVRCWYLSLPDLATDAGDERAFVDRAFRDYLDEQVELRVPTGVSGGEPVFQGREGVVQLSATIRNAWAEWQFDAERLLDAGDRVVVFVRAVGKGRASGVPIEMNNAHVVTILNGRIKSIRVYRDRQQALEAVGLRE
jgi:ketosteroid isomerase-like protein